MNKFDRLSQEEKDLLLTDMYEALNALFGFDAKYDGQKWNDSVKMAIAALEKARGAP